MADNRLGPRNKNALLQALPMEGRATFLPFQDTLPGSVMNQRSFALPGVIAGAVNAFTAPGRAYSGSDPTFNPEEEAANFAMTMGGGGMGASRLAPAPRNALGMNVYHGTPHRFPPTAKNPLGEFDASKINTGEGAQAYGYGHYSAEAKDLAKNYRKNLTLTRGKEIFLDGEPFPRPKLDYTNPDPAQSQLVRIGHLLEQENGNIDRAIARTYGDDVIALESLRGRIDTKPPGNLYTIDLPDKHIAKMLDYDKPLSDQPEILAKVLANPQWRRRLESRTDEEVGTMFGKDLYEMGHDQTAALGILGIRYLDRESRAAGKGTSNFVVFPGNEDMMKIISRE